VSAAGSPASTPHCSAPHSGHSSNSASGWNDETVYGYVVKPASFTAGQKYPIAFLVHGGRR
jgi:hypothetical protein